MPAGLPMHARTSLRRRLWLAGSVSGIIAATLLNPWLGVLAGVVAVTIIFGSTLRRSSDFYVRFIRRAEGERHRVALTFDDGPDPERTPQVLDALDECRAPATFFMIGRRAAESPELVRRVIERGHEIGGHSHSHSRTLPFAPAALQHREMVEGNDALHAAGAPAVRWYRPPMGIATPALARALERSTVRAVNWSVHSRDLADPDAARIAQRVLRRIRGGDIVLMHDGSDRNGAGPAALPAAVRAIVAGLRERGLEPVTLSTLLDATGSGAEPATATASATVAGAAP